MGQRTSKIAVSLFICLFLLLSAVNLKAQDTVAYSIPYKNSFTGHPNDTSTKNFIFTGTQIPLQFTAGYEYNFGNKISARVQAGLITKRYSSIIADIMQVLGMDKYLERVIKKAFNIGNIVGLGANYHFGRNYVGVFGQYMHITGEGITDASIVTH